MITLPGLNPKHADASGIPTPRTLQSICWAAPRLAAEFEPLIQLCELEDTTFIRERPTWDFHFEGPPVQQHECGKTRGIHDLAAFLVSLSSITGTQEDSNSNILRWVVYYAAEEFDALYSKFPNGGLLRGELFKSEYFRLLEHVRHARFMLLDVDEQHQEYARHLTTLEPRNYVIATLALECSITNSNPSDAKSIANALKGMRRTWTNVPWFFDALDNAVTSLLLGSIQQTESAAYYLEQLRHQRLLRGMLR